MKPRSGSGPHAHNIALLLPNEPPGRKYQDDFRKLATVVERTPESILAGELTADSPYYTNFHHAARCLLWDQLLSMWSQTPPKQRALLCRLKSGRDGYTPLGFIAGKDPFNVDVSIVRYCTQPSIVSDSLPVTCEAARAAYQAQLWAEKHHEEHIQYR